MKPHLKTLVVEASATASSVADTAKPKNHTIHNYVHILHRNGLRIPDHHT
jgi:hypothetical protein